MSFTISLVLVSACRILTFCFVFCAARLTPIEGRELRALCMRENDELLGKDSETSVFLEIGCDHEFLN